jgi:hypothetical protein
MKILLVHDIEVESDKGILQWAYARRTHALKKYAPDWADVERCGHHEIPFRRINDYDLVFYLDYTLIPWTVRKLNEANYQGILVGSFNKDDRSRQNAWNTIHKIFSRTPFFQHLIINNLRRFMASSEPQKTYSSYVPIGVDTNIWQNQVAFPQRDNVAIWTGGTGPAKKKGYQEILLPLKQQLFPLGIDLQLRPVNGIVPSEVLNTPELLMWYNSARYVICASETEGGGPNYVMEAMACGCIPICTNVGGVPEFITSSINGFIVSRNVGSFLDAFKYLVKTPNPELVSYSKAATGTMFNHWSYGEPANLAQRYYALFQQLHREQLNVL